MAAAAQLRSDFDGAGAAGAASGRPAIGSRSGGSGAGGDLRGDGRAVGHIQERRLPGAFRSINLLGPSALNLTTRLGRSAT